MHERPQREVSAPGVTHTRDQVLRDKTNVAHHVTPTKKNNGPGKHKHRPRQASAPGIHRRRHLDRRAVTLRGSGPVSGPVAGGRDSELTCVCSRTGVSIGPGDSYPAAERLANVSVRRAVTGQA